MEYMLIEGLSADDIQGQIQQLLDEGWSLQGQLVVGSETQSNRLRFFQAMTRRKAGSSGSIEVEEWV